MAAVLGCMAQGCAGERAGKTATEPDEPRVQTEKRPRVDIDFTKRYDVYVQPALATGKNVEVIKGCRFVGFVSEPEHQAGDDRGRQSGSSAGYKDHNMTRDLKQFWVGGMVLEKDGLRLYLRAEAVVFFVESRPEKQGME